MVKNFYKKCLNKKWTDAGYEILDADVYHILGQNKTESEKKTLTDEQFSNAKKIRNIMPDTKYQYFIQTATHDIKYDDLDEDMEISAVYIRLCLTVEDLIIISCDVEI